MIKDILKINTELLLLNNNNINNSKIFFLNYSKNSLILINFLKDENLIYNLKFCKISNRIYYNYILILNNKIPLLKKIILISKWSHKIYLNFNILNKIYNKNKFKTVISNSVFKLITLNKSKKLNIGGKVLFYYVLN